jgi:hypothetical protein
MLESALEQMWVFVMGSWSGGWLERECFATMLLAREFDQKSESLLVGWLAFVLERKLDLALAQLLLQEQLVLAYQKMGTELVIESQMLEKMLVGVMGYAMETMLVQELDLGWGKV